MENINFRGIPTSLFLNGPKIGIVTDPQDQESVIGVATFTGIATMTSPTEVDGGSININWYYDGARILDTSEDSSSNASIQRFDAVTGTGSTITISGLTVDDDNKEVYFEAEYVPSAYQTTPPVTAGTARSTANAFNEPLRSLSGKVLPLPDLEVVTHPDDVFTSSDAEFSVTGRVNPERYNRTIRYQWQLNENDLPNGSGIYNFDQQQQGTITINGDDGSSQTYDTASSAVIKSFKTNITYTITTNQDVSTKLIAEGAGGGFSGQRSVAGGAGGYAEGSFTFEKGKTYKLRIGGGGKNSGTGGFSGGGDGDSGIHGGGGGGFTGLFETSITIGNAIIIAAGGGGGGNKPSSGGDGGGFTGKDAPSNKGGSGGSQSAGGSGGGNGADGSALQGGSGGSGGGGGYYGGGAGNLHPTCCNDGGGGGGSSYIGGVTDGSTIAGGGSGDRKDGKFTIRLQTPTKKTAKLEVSGAKTPNLKIKNIGGVAPVLVGTSIVESDNGTPTNDSKTRYTPGTKGGPQNKIGKSNKNELGGFTSPNQSPLLLMGSYTSTLVKQRSATWNNIDARNATKITLLTIRGNDFNGGERRNAKSEVLTVQLKTNTSDRGKVISGSYDGNFQNDSSDECAWNVTEIELNPEERVNGLTIILKNSVTGAPEFSSDIKDVVPGNEDQLYKNAGDVYGINWVRLNDNNDNVIQELSFNEISRVNAGIRCKLSADNVVSSPVFSDSASYVIKPPTNILNIEEYRYDDETAILHDFDLDKTKESTAVCISVVDETNNQYDIQSEVDADWNTFRTNYPKRPFWILRPGNETVTLPTAWDFDPFTNGPIKVNRDGGQSSSRSDWFTITELDKAPAGTNVSLVLDQSGSMTKKTVTASLSLFLEKCAAAGIVVNGGTNAEIVMKPIEKYISQHNRDLAGDLSNALVIDYDKYPGNAVCLYARDQDINVQMELYGGRGENKGSKSGGDGGYSKITLTMKKDEEYVVTGLFSAVNAPFLYRKGTLIAVVGEGGDAGTESNGGDGGGITVKGENGGQNKGGAGGQKIAPGSLPSDGIFGSLTTLTPVAPDSKATDQTGGRTLPCTRGSYWRDQGKSPCENLGEIKFRIPNGTELSNTAEIERGYKSGYNIIQTKGSGQTDDSGDGGSGAGGGDGGRGNYGGGGGTGYTDGSVTVVKKEGTSIFPEAKLVIRLV